MNRIRIIVSIVLYIFPFINFAQEGKKIESDWHFIYYMPYDNNLSRFSTPIIDMIQNNINSDKISVTIQLDDRKTNGSKRYLITSESTNKYQIPDESSDDINTYKSYLEWVESIVSYKKKAVIFLDHGGKLNEVGLDEYPNNGFLTIEDIQKTFIDLYKSKIDLLFFQVCTKSIIEPLFEFKDLSHYTLASQIELGAPNSYYPEVFKFISKNSKIGPTELALKIMNEEALNMYSSYTLINNKKFPKFYKIFKRLLNKIPNNKENSIKKPLTYSYYEENYYDLVSYLNHIKLKNKTFIKKRKKLINFIKNELIESHKINPYKPKMKKYCGLSFSAESNNSYKSMQIYKLTEKLRDIELSTE